jgi:phage baseplate assembly protein W
MRNDNFLGVGWAFEPRLDSRGRVALSRGVADIEEAIRIILLTNKGERIMRPTFGSNLFRLQFEPNNAATAGLARRLVIEALEQWEPRIEVLEVYAEPHPENDAALLIEIEYRIASTGEQTTLDIAYALGTEDA